MVTENLPRVTIIILNWNGGKDTLECLESIYQNHYPHYQVVVVDNASSDDSISKIREYCKGKIKVESPLLDYTLENKPINYSEYTPMELKSVTKEDFQDHFNHLTLIKNDENEGFSKANNQAMEYALQKGTDYVVLLNNDTVMDKKAISHLIDCFESQEEVGAVGSTVLDYDNKGRFNIIQSQGGRLDFKKYPGYFPQNKGLVYESDKEEYQECDWITGAAVMIKKEALTSGLLNEDFFFGCEDVDFSIRLKKQEYKLMVATPAKIWHKGGATRQKNLSSFKRNVKNNLTLLKMHNEHYTLYLPLYGVYILVQLVDFFIK